MAIPDSATVDILLFGELLADQFPDGDRIGGAPLNVARHLQAFGVRARLLSRIGSDELGRRLLRLLDGWGMDTRGIQIDAQHPTGRVRVHMDADGHRFEILPDQAYDHVDAGAALQQMGAVPPALLYFGTLAQRSEVSRQALAALLEALPVPRFLDLNLRPPWVERAVIEASLTNADLLKLNRQELSDLAALLDLPPAAAPELAARLASQFSLKTVLVTEGAEGAWLLDAAGGLTSTETGTPGIAPEGDTVGAGDAFSAVFLLGRIRGWPPQLTLRRANAFAGAVCGIRGAVPPEDSFYRPFLNEWDGPPARPGGADPSAQTGGDTA